VNQKPNPAQVLSDLISESIDAKVFYRLIEEHEFELASKRVADPREHAAWIVEQALDMLTRDPGLLDLLQDGMMTALKDWYDKDEGI
jgi:hypothetical protein